MYSVIFVKVLCEVIPTIVDLSIVNAREETYNSSGDLSLTQSIRVWDIFGKKFLGIKTQYRVWRGWVYTPGSEQRNKLFPKHR